MNHVTGIHHTSFTVADLDQSLAFFRDHLGLEVVLIREIAADYFGAIVGLPGCVVKAAMLRLPGAQHLVELFQYLTPPTVAADPPHPTLSPARGEGRVGGFGRATPAAITWPCW